MNVYATRALVTFLFVVSLWNLTKLPFYMSFNNDGDVAYNSHGIELSINLGHWVKGYRSLKMRTPPCNFFLVHATLGITALTMILFTVIKGERRRKYCIPFFIFSIVEGLHILPAAWINDSSFLVALFTFASLSLVVAGVWGIWTKTTLYEKDPVTAEKYLLYQYIIVGVMNSGAAFLEVPNIMKAFKSKEEDGVFQSYGEEPHFRVGNTFYDGLPEKYGYAFFLIFTTSVWFIWPLLLATPKPAKTIQDGDNVEATEATPLTR